MDDEGFILEDENYSINIDTTHPFYKENSKKDIPCAEIAQKFGVEGR